MLERLGVGPRRLLNRVAYAAFTVASPLLRPHLRGVKCAVVCGDDLLLVRHAYGPRAWDLPGGFCRRGEAFEDAARRELREELGVELAGLTPLEAPALVARRRREALRLFRAELRGRSLTVDGGEIVEARWFEGRLPEARSEVVDALLALGELGSRA